MSDMPETGDRSYRYSFARTRRAEVGSVGGDFPLAAVSQLSGVGSAVLAFESFVPGFVHSRAAGSDASPLVPGHI
jgi:hypothetical protein